MKPITNCLSCGAVLTGPFCAQCGERSLDEHDRSLINYFESAAEALFHFDGKVFRSLRLLLIAPGFLTKEYMRGRRRPFLAPLPLFLLVNLVFFVVYPLFHVDALTTGLDNHTKHQLYAPLVQGVAERALARSQQSPEQFESRFDAVATLEAKSLVILMVPLFAVVTALLHLGRRDGAVQHLTYATHFMAAWLVMVALLLACVDLFALTFGPQHRWLIGGQLDKAVVLVLTVLQAVYLWFGFRSAYAETRVSAAWKAAIASIANFFVVLVIYRFILFFATLAAM